MWKRHWKLSRDPFLGPGAPFVPVGSHAEAVARLVDTIETGQRRAVLRAGGGLGKTSVLARALAETRSPWRRSVFLSCPTDGPALLAGLAEGLGRRLPTGASRGLGWKALEEGVRLCRWQRQGVVLAIDDCQHLATAADRLDLERLVHLDPHPESRLTVLLATSRDEVDERADPETDPASRWDLLIRLPPLTRGETEAYLAARLAAAGRDEPIFTPRAIQRLHLASGGNPRGLGRLASLSLMAGGLRGLEVVTPEVVEGVARECVSSPLGVGR